MMETPGQPEPQSSNKGLLIAIGGVIALFLLVCCCAFVVIALLTMMGPAVGNVFSSINNSLMTPEIPSNLPTMPSTSDLVPQGGRGNEVLRASTWGYVVAAAALDNCGYNLQAADTKIKVTQEPDSSGEWKEQWTVKCDDGSAKPYDVTFTPSAGGGTDIKVTAGK